MRSPTLRHILTAAAVATIWLGRAPAPLAAPTSSQAQLSFASAEDAARALADAARAHDIGALRKIFGPGSGSLTNSGDRYADAEQERHFAALYDQKHEIVPAGGDRAVLEVGTNDWPLPIPLVRKGGRWRFDTAAGQQEIVNRRIGRNELAAIQVCLAYVEAQRDFFALKKQETGTGYYADRLASEPGRHDGLYWPAAAGEPESPLGPLVREAEEQGYPGELIGGNPDPYQGYYYRILRGQGHDTPEGERNYIVGGKMTGGFALLAWPASYGVSGVMTFMVNQDGVVFQKDLGPDTAEEAARTSLFDPDISWTEIEVSDH